MREIDRSRYLRGTKAWAVRNWFVFGGLAFTILLGTASVVMVPGVKQKVLEKVEEEKATKTARREKLTAIRRHREELEMQNSSESTE